MKTKQITAAALLAAAMAAQAAPSVGTDATQSTETTDSSTLVREKKMSIDKSNSKSKTISRSKEHARERSQEQSASKRKSKEARASKSFSKDVNINSMLLAEFVRHYEQQIPSAGQPEVVRYFATCKPLTAAQRDYPTLNTQTPPVSVGDLFRDNAVTGRGSALPMTVSAMRSVGSEFFQGTAENYPADPQIPTISRYAQCRMTASSWIAAAAEKVSAAPVHDVSEIARNIASAFSAMDADSRLFLSLRQQARDDWAHAQCTPWLKWQGDYRGPEIDCGVFEFKGDKFYVNRRETLSESAIAGASYKIAINSDQSTSSSTELASSTTSRVSDSDRNGVTVDVSTENRQSDSMGKTKSSTSGDSSVYRDGATNSINATPGQQ